MIRIMIVDDDASFRRRVRDILSPEAGIEVIGEAASGLEALCKARKLRPNLVLMDIRMPGMNGFTFRQRIRADTRCRR